MLYLSSGGGAAVLHNLMEFAFLEIEVARQLARCVFEFRDLSRDMGCELADGEWMLRGSHWS